MLIRFIFTFELSYHINLTDNRVIVLPTEQK
jgi:hypothetical protein